MLVKWTILTILEINYSNEVVGHWSSLLLALGIGLGAHESSWMDLVVFCWRVSVGGTSRWKKRVRRWSMYRTRWVFQVDGSFVVECLAVSP